MFDKLEDLLIRFEELMSELSEPDVANDPVRFRKLMKEQSDLTPIVNAYKEYKQCKQNIEDSLALLEEESDEEMRELAKEELNDSKARVEELEKELKILLLPKDPNDDKNVIVEPIAFISAFSSPAAELILIALRELEQTSSANPAEADYPRMARSLPIRQSSPNLSMGDFLLLMLLILSNHIYSLSLAIAASIQDILPVYFAQFPVSF